MDISRTKYPIGIQTFEKIRSEGYAYVDKTGYIRRLLDNQYYFLSRPRRFGKSLLLSTLEAYFRGRSDLFKGLEIEKYENEWVEYPVVHIDFSSMNGAKTENLMGDLRLSLSDIAESYGISIDIEGLTIERIFSVLIESLYKKYGKGVVILIDEYDKGIIEVLHDESLKDNAISLLRPFFSVLKSHDRYIRFAFITGVSRFRNTTIFSGFNNPYDISMQDDYAAICGITRTELVGNFGEGISRLAEKYGYSREKTVEVLLQKYDGYRFACRKEYVCNPFSLLNALYSSAIRNYWVMSGSSRILADFIRGSRLDLESLTSGWVAADRLSGTYSRDNPQSLFFQTGYLTIAECSDEDYYRLRIPNQEVQYTLVNLLIPEFSQLSEETVSDDQRVLREAINAGDVDRMMGTLRSIVSSVPYHEIVGERVLERHIHLCMHIIFMMLGVSTRCEVCTSSGRVDMVAQTPWRVYVFEYKVDTPASEALRQIGDRGYAIQWESRGREVTKIGVSFSSSTRTIEEWAAG